MKLTTYKKPAVFKLSAVTEIRGYGAKFREAYQAFLYAGMLLCLVS